MRAKRELPQFRVDHGAEAVSGGGKAHREPVLNAWADFHVPQPARESCRVPVEQGDSAPRVVDQKHQELLNHRQQARSAGPLRTEPGRQRNELTDRWDEDHTWKSVEGKYSLGGSYHRNSSNR